MRRIIFASFVLGALSVFTLTTEVHAQKADKEQEKVKKEADKNTKEAEKEAQEAKTEAVKEAHESQNPLRHYFNKRITT
jgi:nitrate reductase cytochrome c-type subunit